MTKETTTSKTIIKESFKRNNNNDKKEMAKDNNNYKQIDVIMMKNVPHTISELGPPHMLIVVFSQQLVAFYFYY